MKRLHREDAARTQRVYWRADLPGLTGLSIPRINQLIRKGQFPRPQKLGTRLFGWTESRLTDWLNRNGQDR